MLMTGIAVSLETKSNNSSNWWISFLIISLLVIIFIITLIVIAYRQQNQKEKKQTSNFQNNVNVPPDNSSIQNQESTSTTTNLSENTKSNHIFLKLIIKLLFIVALVFAALINYRIYTVGVGFTTRKFDKKNFSDVIYEFTGIEKIEYYKKTIPNGELTYTVFISTRGDNYLCGASEDEIKYLKIVGTTLNVPTKKVTIVPFYVEIIAGIIILIIPFGRRRRN